jgi:hypothetical protein
MPPSGPSTVVRGDLEPIEAGELGHNAHCWIPCLAVPLGFVVLLLGGFHLDYCLIVQVFDHQVDGCVPNVDVLFLEGCKCIIAHTIEDELLACLLGSEVFCVACLLFLVVCD